MSISNNANEASQSNGDGISNSYGSTLTTENGNATGEGDRILKQMPGESTAEREEEATYWNLLKKNRSFRLYILSYVTTHSGEWLTYIASISLAEKILSASGTTSRTTISILVVVRLLPNVFLSPFGGILADGRDRRESMIFLDILGSICPLFFLIAMHYESILLIYFVTFLQQCVSGLYEPCVSSILPLMVADMPRSDDYLKKATTLAGISWSLFAAVGSSIGGLVLTWFGFRACFFLDSLTYLTSAYLLYLIGGTWNVATENTEHSSVWSQIRGMAIDGILYLKSSFFGGLVLLKASGAIVYGASDVLNVSFSEPNGFDDPNSPARLGTLFAIMGFGYTLGPLIADRFTDMNQPTSLQKACIIGIASAAIGFGAMAFFDPFWTICAFSLVRSAGASINWIDSSILLQKFATDEMMGRVLAVDFSLALLSEATSAYIAGYLQDHWNLNAHQVALVMACIGFSVVFLWLLYHLSGRGAGAAPRETKNAEDEQKQQESNQTDNETAPLL